MGQPAQTLGGTWQFREGSERVPKRMREVTFQERTL